MFFFSAIQNEFDGEKALHNVPKCLQICWIFDLKGGFPSFTLFFSNSHTCKHWVDIYSKLQNPENKVISIKHLMAEKLQRNKHHRTFSEEVKAYRLRSIFFLLLFITVDRAQLVARLTCGHSAYIITKKQHVNECQMQVTFKSFIFIV